MCPRSLGPQLGRPTLQKPGAFPRASGLRALRLPFGILPPVPPRAPSQRILQCCHWSFPPSSKLCLAHRSWKWHVGKFGSGDTFSKNRGGNTGHPQRLGESRSLLLADDHVLILT